MGAVAFRAWGTLLLLSVASSALAEPDPNRPRPRRPGSRPPASTPIAPPAQAPAPTPQEAPPLPSEEPAPSPSESASPRPPPRPGRPRSLPPAREEDRPAAAGAFLPPILPAHDALEPPPGYRLETGYNRGLFYGGLLVLGAGYGIALGYGAANGFSEGLGLLAIPLVGPFIAIGQRDLDCSIGPVTPGVDPTVEVNACQKKLVSEATTIATLSAIGVVELFGAGLTVIGLLDRDRTWVRNDVELGTLRFRPLVLPAGAGIVGSF